MINHMIVYGKDRGMRSFYYDVWVPFTINKRRILILTIATYMALC
jgi:hypothetical protein